LSATPTVYSRALPTPAGRADHAAQTSKEERLIYELRIYHCVSGRLPALLKRFEGTTLALWAKHGIRQAGFWTVIVGDSNQDLYYLLQWESLAEREKKWTAFMSDPEWVAKRAESERDGPIVASLANTILQPTAFSAVK
jgi:NIPSNAP protein